MATVTLTANTDYSALSLANDDTIDCAGYILTLDIQPTHTGIQVTSPGTAGTVVFDDAWVIPTWDFFVGTSGSGGMIGTLPEGAEIGSITGGTSTNSRGIETNNGTVGVVTGGSATGSHGITTNNGIVGTSNGSTAANANGVTTNYNYVGTARGGISNSMGVSTNRGFVGHAIGGSGGSARGVNSNNGTVVLAEGGEDSTTPGIDINSGICLRIVDTDANSVSTWYGRYCFVEGPHINGVIPDNIKTIYSLGTLSGGATIAGDATVIEMELAGGGGGGSGPSRPRQGNLLGRSF